LARGARSRCLVNHLHLFFVHPATAHLDSGDSRADLTKIRWRQLNRAVLDDWCRSFPGFHLSYPGRRDVTPAPRAFIEAMKGDG
jgi:hypothetical protein